MANKAKLTNKAKSTGSTIGSTTKKPGRQKFDDQSNVDKLYSWIKSGIKSAEAGFPAQTLGGTYTYEKPKK